ncbi:solute carrier family 23 protein, partial [Burkholderia pseudomallei]|uniref:solute carrier family 23 protein n=1 Tax=Burkholderia pseudomallei TaxID=28450 RepID=UPI00299E655A
FPTPVFAQNNGLIQLTGIASRHAGLWNAGMPVLLGLFPVGAGVLQAVPEPGLAGPPTVMVRALAPSAVNILPALRLDRRPLLSVSRGRAQPRRLPAAEAPPIVAATAKILCPRPVRDFITHGLVRLQSLTRTRRTTPPYPCSPHHDPNLTPVHR